MGSGDVLGRPRGAGGGLWRAQRSPERIGFSLALGGGLGNLIDRLTRGAVTDWIHVAGYPATFNLADIAVRVGLLIALAGRSTGLVEPGVGLEGDPREPERIEMFLGQESNSFERTADGLAEDVPA